MPRRAGRAFAALATLACAPADQGRAAPDTARASAALVATSGVTRAGGDARAFHVAPLGRMSGDVEILHGHPDSAGPFVMRIRELAGTVVPPHTHPVDEHITV